MPWTSFRGAGQPDGSRIVYATCALSEDSEREDGSDKKVYNYEIFVSDSDGANTWRLTNNTHFDVLPAWSPDGGRVAFISDPDRNLLEYRSTVTEGVSRVKHVAAGRLTVHTAATGENREIALPAGRAVAPYRLEWSPNGERIAFVALEGEDHPWNTAVYTVGADGSGLSRVSDTDSGPAWSPDGEAIAMIVTEGDDELALYTFAADGSNPVRADFSVDRLSTAGSSWVRSKFWMGNLSWSPDGSAILLESIKPVSEYKPAVVYLDGAGGEAGVLGAFEVRTRVMAAGMGGAALASPPNTILPLRIFAAWSPDGSRIAVRGSYGYETLDLYVMDRLGNNVVALVPWSQGFVENIE